MVEFFGAFCGALLGVFIPVGICMYRVDRYVKETCNKLKDSLIVLG